ncbi:MAG: 16S rRNA (uracil(1498)-N(3))-methyltransferase [Caldisericia bacterium]|nr:16S rRNA (uracil(1498)-N(3))-methyltransferase [Caldisericia bacterium]
MARFYVESGDSLTGGDFHHAVNVLRLGLGEEIEIVQGLGLRFKAKLTKIDNNLKEAKFEVIEKINVSTEPPATLTLIMGIPRPDKLPEIIEYCTQLGVSKFVLAKCARSQTDAGRIDKKIDHFQKIAKSAAELAGREVIPTIEEPTTLAMALTKAKGLRLIPWELEAETTIGKAFQPCTEVTTCIGPEGGLERAEIEMAKAQGFVPVTLGKRILRAQLAPVVAVSQVLAFLENL